MKLLDIFRAIPDVVTPYSQIANSTTMRDGNGVLYKLGAAVAAGGTANFAHTLGRKPNRAQVMANPGAYGGDCFITASDPTNVTIQFEMAQNIGSVIRVV